MKPEGNIPLGRLRCRWEDNVEIALNQQVEEGVDWIPLAQNRD
jgi:hypothetical protein